MSNVVRELNSAALVQLVARRWPVLVLVPLLTLAAAALAWYVLPDRYQSSAQLLIQDQRTVNPSLKELLADFSVQQRLPLIHSVLQSHTTSERVLRKLGHLDDTATPEEVNQAVADFQGQVQVIGLGGALVMINVRGETPSEAYEAITALIETFTEQILSPQKETVRASAAFLEDQIHRLRGEPVDAERPDIEMQKGSMDKHLDIRKALVEGEVRLASAEQQVALSQARLKQLSLSEERPPHQSAGVRKIGRDLADARSELLELEHVYEEDHPERAAAKKRVDWLQQALRRARRRSQETSARALRDRQAVSGAQPQADTSAVSRHGVLVLELEGARAEVELLRQRLLTEELTIFESENQVWTVEAPVKPTHSLKPALLFVLLGATLAGLVLAILAIAFFAAFDDALRGEKELAAALGAPSLGRMPRGEV